MRCPYCDHTESKVVDKRETEDERVTRRRRECLKCEKRYTTYERVEKVNLTIVKKDNKREQFDKSKLMHGLLRACEKRPVTREQIERLVSEVEQELGGSGKKEIKSHLIGEAVMDKLKDIDDVAYIRFASVYREFADIKSFEAALKQLKKK